ncbi:Major Facilitator Superfamily protein [Streptomyces sp. 2112.3]|uniref:MFS transporter n=1 Tax=Streptomyces sp. 2112.3 TaxID=1881023 RepID=UPI000896DDAD|nr:MFS transporter [Streptomyces sp. 2112.3]SEE56642.1 Major Facilitator Superfamily protein [Streptomyces sp. 2112.3]
MTDIRLSRGLTLCLMSLVCVPQLALAAFVPAIPQIGAHFGAGESDLSRSMVGYMAAYAISMLVTGQLADRYGAKRTQLAGLALFAGASALCLLAPNVAVFIAGRVLQALGAGAGTVIARLWVQKDLPQRERLNVLTALTTVIAVTPAVSPPLAGLLVQYASWRMLFVCMTAVGIGTLVGAVFLLPSDKPRNGLQPAAGRQTTGPGTGPSSGTGTGTGPGTGTGTGPEAGPAAAPAPAPAPSPEPPPRTSPEGPLTAYRRILGNRDFSVFATAISLAWCAYFTFTTYSSHAIQVGLGASPVEYGALYTLVIAGYVTGSSVAKRLGRVRSLELVARLASSVAAAAALVMSVSVRIWPDEPLSLVVPMAFCMVGVGAMFPTCQAGMMRYDGQHAGAASGLFFALQMASGAAYTGVTGLGGDPEFPGLAVAIALPALALLLVCAVLMHSAAERSPQGPADAPRPAPERQPGTEPERPAVQPEPSTTAARHHEKHGS